MRPFDIEQQAADVAAILDALGVGRAIVVGHSLGGVVALVLNDRRPDLVTGLLLGDSPVRSGGLDGSRLVQSIREDGPEAAKALVENFWSDSTSDDVKDRVRGMMLPCPPDVLCGMLEMAPSAERMLELVRLADSKPFMTIWAERPAGDPAWLRETTMFIRQEPMAGAGHFFQLERPDVTNALIRAFIEETARDPRIDSQRG
jgi:pimeloyl-ACP methyl ester carboxylesterase